MKNITFKGNMNIDNQEEEINENELFSLKITDSLYKKDIGKFLEILSSHFIQLFKKKILDNVQIQTVRKINKFLEDNKIMLLKI